jgi:hypothetical protein
MVIFLLCVIFVSYIIPFLDFGRFFGTDDYTHISSTQGIDASEGILDYYSRMGEGASDPENPGNFYNYPFGLWFFGSLVSKLSGLTVLNGNFIGVIFYFAVIIGTYYFYSGLFLTSKEQKIIALLFMLSMPNVVLILFNYRPSVFVLPFLFIILYTALQESVNWKLYPVLWLSVFIVTISHTGTFIFLISMSLGFFLLYSLFWGRFSRNVYVTIVSTFFIYIITLSWFPEISNQYQVKSTLFLSPGNFLANKFNFFLLQDFGNIFYQNFFVGQQLVYALLFAVALYGTAQVLIYIHRHVSIFISKRTFFPAFVLPIQNISHSAIASPIWLGPLHVLLSIPGFFHLDAKGKCLFITVIFTTLLPDLLNTSEGIEVATGALREISFLIVIIPITATLGLGWVLSTLKQMKIPYKIPITFMVWFFVFSVVIITSAVGTTYYLPKIAGEDYSINGMRWLGDNGQTHENVVGYGYRTVPIFTNMPSPFVEAGSETRLFTRLLQNIHFSSGEENVNNLRQIFDVKYILSSDKVVTNLGGTRTNVKIDSNRELDKIYSSRDFGIYESTSSAGNSIPEYSIALGTTIKKVGSVFQITSDYYTAAIGENTPILERFGTKQKNYFGAGFLSENFVLSSGPDRDIFVLSDLQFSSEIKNNQILYRTILNGTDSRDSSLVVRYTFYPKVIKREYLVSNDWFVSNKSSTIKTQFSSLLFSPLSNYIITNNQERQTRRIYESEDTVTKTIEIRDIYIFNPDTQRNLEKQGIRVQYFPSSPYPVTVSYKGSTIYQISGITISQSNSLLSGKSLHITQFLSTGDELGTENNILSQTGLQLNNYPDGIDPIIVAGLGSSFSEDGYTLLKNSSIPYFQIIRPALTISNITETERSNEDEITPWNEEPLGDEETLGNDSTIITEPTSALGLPMNEMTNLTSRGVGIIGSASLMPRNYDNMTMQRKTIESLQEYTKSSGVTSNGFMPASFLYNLDTVKILNDKKISFMLSNPVSPTMGSFIGGYRTPELAYYNNKPTRVVMIPVSYPISSSLHSQENSSILFSQWRDILDKTADNDEMTLFLFNSEDIGDPEYSENFTRLFSYAKEQGYTFTSPEIIADHYRQLQNLEYSGSTEIDKASINVTNNNDKMISNVTFKVVLEALTSGNYTTSEGRIVKTEVHNTSQFIYVSTDIPAHSTQTLIITPNTERKHLQVELPEFLTEGIGIIKVKDEVGKPIYGAEVLVDTNFYRTDKDGKVNVDFQRGTVNVIIQSPGYERYSKIIEVRGRFFNIVQFFDKFV